jgi:hypothetical protein
MNNDPLEDMQKGSVNRWPKFDQEIFEQPHLISYRVSDRVKGVSV